MQLAGVALNAGRSGEEWFRNSTRARDVFISLISFTSIQPLTFQEVI